MDIIIFSGQSNMQGETDVLSSTKRINGALEYRYLTDTAVPLCNPVGENITYNGLEGYTFTFEIDSQKWLETHALGASCFGYTNLVPSFCDAYCKKTRREVLAVHAAKGSTAIESWMPGRPQYQMLIAKAFSAIRYAETHGGVGQIFFVWLQGESDAIMSNTKQYYKDSIIRLYDALSDTLQITKFGIIRVGHFCGDERDLEIIGAQDEVCYEHTGFLMLTTLTEQLSTISDCMHPHSKGHFSAKGLEILGTAAGEALANEINYKYEGEYHHVQQNY